MEHTTPASKAASAPTTQAAPENIRSILVRCREFIDTTKAPAYPAGADLADEIDMVLAAQPASAQADTSLLLSFAPHFNGCETPEPSLSAIIYRYYRAHFEDRSEADALAHDYIRALASAAQPSAVPAAVVEPSWSDAANWLRSNYQDYPNIASLCEGMIAASPYAVAVPVKWWNGCDKTVPDALRYLAENERPIGGEERFNCAHLYQLADEIERMARLPLYTAPVPAAQGDALDAARYRWLRLCNLAKHPAVRDGFELGDAHLDAAIDTARGAQGESNG